MHRALFSARIPSRLEPSGINQSDGKRPDGITLASIMGERDASRVGCDVH